MAVEDRLIWVDMEMTGLDPDKERIIEVALIVTDSALDVVAEADDIVIHQDESLLAAMDTWNTEHHTASGLVDRVRASSIDEGEAEQTLLRFLAEHTPEGVCPLAGNSVHQDRRFIRRYMPRLDAWLHYRHVDVSTVKELVGRWYPEAFKKRPTKSSAHRALDDIRESIEELRFYRTIAFR